MDFIPYGLVIVIAALTLSIAVCCCLRQCTNKSGARKDDISRLESGQLPKLEISTISNKIDNVPNQQVSKEGNGVNNLQARTPTSIIVVTPRKEDDPKSNPAYSHLLSQRSQISTLSSQVEKLSNETKELEIRPTSKQQPGVHNLNWQGSYLLNQFLSQNNFPEQSVVKKTFNENLQPKPNLNSVPINFEPRRIDIIDTTSVNPFAVAKPKSNLNANLRRDVSPIFRLDNEISKPKAVLRTRENLYVDEVLSKDFRIPNKTKINHLYCGPGGLNKHRAVEISERRGSYFGSNISSANTVFKKPQDFWLCQTSDRQNPKIVLSRQKVETYQCLYDVTQNSWSADFAGHYHAIFTNNGQHFPGYVYRNVDFPESSDDSDSETDDYTYNVYNDNYNRNRQWQRRGRERHRY